MQKLFLSIFLALSVSIQAADTLQVQLKPLEVQAEIRKTYTQLGRVVSVIERSQIASMPVSSIDQLLESIAGVDVRQRGVEGTQADISIRGGSFDQVLILLNGVNITDPQTGHHNLNIPVNLADVERVEILQGPAARLLGPNAFSGAINIVTEHSKARMLNARMGIGSFGYNTQSLTAGFDRTNFNTLATLNRTTSKGYIPNTDFETINAFAQATLRANYGGKYSMQLAQQIKDFGANAFYSFRFPNQFEHTKTTLFSADAQQTIDKLQLSLGGYYRQNYDRFELFRDMKNASSWYTAHNYHISTVAGAKFTSSLSTHFGKFSVLAEYRNEGIVSTVLGDAIDSIVNPYQKDVSFTKGKNRAITHAALDYSLFLSRVFVSAGGAISHSNDFGPQYTWGVDASYSFSPDLQVFVASNSAVRLPTFTDLYYRSATQNANPNLQPEHAMSFETGVKFKRQHFKTDVTLYRRLATNVIDWVLLPGNAKWESRNMTGINTTGLDVSAAYNFEAKFFKQFSMSYSYVLLDKQAEGFDSKYALDYLKHNMQLGLKHALVCRWVANWTVAYNHREGNYTDFRTSQIADYKPFVLVNARVEMPAKQYTLYVDARNILNTTYADFGGLTQPGFHLMAGININLK